MREARPLATELKAGPHANPCALSTEPTGERPRLPLAEFGHPGGRDRRSRPPSEALA